MTVLAKANNNLTDRQLEADIITTVSRLALVPTLLPINYVSGGEAYHSSPPIATNTRLHTPTLIYTFMLN
jgi:hypothetical protein